MGEEVGAVIFEKSKGSQCDWSVMRKRKNAVR